MRGNPHSKPEAFGPIPFIDVLFCRDGCTMLMPARECVTILLGLLFEFAEIAQIFIIKYSRCQVFWLSKSHALSNRQRIRRRRQASGRMERVRRIELPTLSLAIIAIRSTGVDFIANFPEIHPIF